MFVSLKRTIKAGWINFRRNTSLSIVGVFVISLTILLTISIFAVRDFGQVIIDDVQDKMSISLYFKENVDEVTVLETKDAIDGLDDVTEIRYISQSQALEDFIQRYKDNPVIMAGVAEIGDSFLRPTLVIKSDTLEGYDNIVAFLEDSPSRIFFDEIDYARRRAVIENIFAIIDIITKIGVVLAITMGLIAMLIVISTVKLAAYGMKEEIEVLRLVGVSRRFILSSFIIQGLIIGLSAAILSFAIVFGSGLFFGDKLSIFIPGLDLMSYLRENFAIIILIQFGVGILLGTLSSLITTRKYLKV